MPVIRADGKGASRLDENCGREVSSLRKTAGVYTLYALFEIRKVLLRRLAADGIEWCT